MTPFQPELWHDLFVMTGGATAALAGLIFVAVSLNQEDILKIPALTALAARTLTVLISIVLFCLVGLIPAQSQMMFGLEVFAIGASLTAITVGTTLRNLAGSKLIRWKVRLVGEAILASIFGVIAGISLILGTDDGLYWLLGQFVAGIIIAVYKAWILLIEIRR